MPNPTTILPSQSLEALDIQVRGLEADVGEIKDSILGLDAKLNQSISTLANEVRAAVKSLSDQFNERQRTPWQQIIAGAGFLVVVLGMFGTQALSPVQSDIKELKSDIVPRVEHNFRQQATDQRFAALEARILQNENRRYEDMIKTNERLELELRELRKARNAP